MYLIAFDRRDVIWDIGVCRYFFHCILTFIWCQSASKTNTENLTLTVFSFVDFCLFLFYGFHWSIRRDCQTISGCASCPSTFLNHCTKTNGREKTKESESEKWEWYKRQEIVPISTQFRNVVTKLRNCNEDTVTFFFNNFIFIYFSIACHAERNISCPYYSQVTSQSSDEQTF